MVHIHCILVHWKQYRNTSSTFGSLKTRKSERPSPCSTSVEPAPSPETRWATSSVPWDRILHRLKSQSSPASTSGTVSAHRMGPARFQWRWCQAGTRLLTELIRIYSAQSTTTPSLRFCIDLMATSLLDQRVRLSFLLPGPATCERS